MNKDSKMSTWRVGYAVLIYGILYAGANNIAPYWMLSFALPFYMLLKPVRADLCDTHLKIHQDGLVFYVFKWGGITIGLIVAIFFTYSLQFGLEIVSVLKAVVNNSFVTVPILLSVLVSWIVNERHYLLNCTDMGKDASTPRQKKNQRKNKKC